jgi:hypothetical protein
MSRSVRKQQKLLRTSVTPKVEQGSQNLLPGARLDFNRDAISDRAIDITIASYLVGCSHPRTTRVARLAGGLANDLLPVLVMFTHPDLPPLLASSWRYGDRPKAVRPFRQASSQLSDSEEHLIRHLSADGG